MDDGIGKINSDCYFSGTSRTEKERRRGTFLTARCHHQKWRTIESMAFSSFKWLGNL